jgi:predicted metallopeptidase
MSLKLVATSAGLVNDTLLETKNLKVVPEDFYPIANKVIKDNDLGWLKNYQIKYLFATKPRNKAGASVLGTCKIFSDKDKLLHNWDVLIILDEAFWNTYPENREPLLFHEFCHIFQDELGRLLTVNHDIEEFNAVWHKYGDWLGELKRAKIQQLTLKLAS